MRLFGTGRAAGGWGIVFVVILLISAAMVSLPTGAETGTKIATFYKAHGSVIALQQILGAIAVAPFVAFALSIGRNRWLKPVVAVFVAFELATNAIPLVMVAMSNLSADTAYTLTVVEDFADAGLFVSVAAFAIVAPMGDSLWIRAIGIAVAIACVARAVAGLVGIGALDFVAPLAFIAFVLLLSLRLLLGADEGGPARPAAHRA